MQEVTYWACEVHTQKCLIHVRGGGEQYLSLDIIYVRINELTMVEFF